MHVGKEGGAVHRSIEHHRRGDAGEPQARHEGGGFPMTLRDAGTQPLAFLSPAA
jgi:hypothetical protein